MINETYVEKLISLIKNGIISIEDIKNTEYKLEVQKKLSE